MAKKQSDARRRAVSGENGFRGFICHNVTRDERAAFQQWAETYDEHAMWLDVERLVDSGYKIGLKYDEYNRSMLASLTCWVVDSPDYGWTLTARAPEVRLAIALLFFKHNVLLGGDWQAFHERPAEEREWG